MAEMSYKTFKNEIRLSRLGMGNMRLPVKMGEPGEPIDYEAAKEIIDQAMKAGINYYDTAYIYHGGKSEEFVGKALKEYTRDSYYVADKFNYQANPDYKEQFAQQLNRLEMERIDFYLIHGVQDYFIEEAISCGCISYFDQMKKEGKIRYFGFSFHGTPQALKKMLGAYSWDFVQIQLNYYDWFFESAKELYEILTEANIPIMVMEPVHGGLLADLGAEANEILKEEKPDYSIASWALYEILTEANIPIMVMEPVHGGLLADLGAEANEILKEEKPDYSIASWAIRWVKSLPGVQVILSGMSDPVQLWDNVKTISETADITETEKKSLEKAAAIVRANTAVPCTKCRYCVPNCPMELNIPLLLSQYNDAKLSGTWRLNNLESIVKEKLPSACISCGTCTGYCPQNFDIPHYMAELAEMMLSLS